MTHRLTAVLLSLAFSSVVFPVHAGDDLPETEYYPLKIGNTWTYRVGKEDGYTGETKVVRHEKGKEALVAVLESTKDGVVIKTEKISVTKTGISRSVSTLLGEQSIQLLKLPPKQGDSWKSEIGFTSTVAFEAVEVPAGKFKDAVIVTSKMTSPRGLIESRWWFVSGTGVVKQETKVGKDEPILTELVKYVPAK